MGHLKVRGRIPLSQTVLKRCDKCQKVFSEAYDFCPICGNKLISEKTSVYANVGNKGITSVTYKLGNGISINSKGNVSFSLSKGVSYTTRLKGK